MKVITCAMQKGGVGKSAISMAVAVEIAKNHKTVLIDADPQGNSTNAMLENVNFELADVLQGKCQVQEATEKTAVENLFMIPTKSLSPELRTYRQTQAVREPFIFCDLKDELEKQGFEYCVIDTCPAFDVFEENILQATDEVLPVIFLELFSLDGYTIFQNLLNDFKKRKRTQNPVLKTVVLNNYDSRKAISSQIRQQFVDSGSNFHLVQSDQSFQRSINARIPVQYLQGTKKETLEAISEIAREVE